VLFIVFSQDFGEICICMFTSTNNCVPTKILILMVKWWGGGENGVCICVFGQSCSFLLPSDLVLF
jgi:hypothetical protein